MDWTLYWFMFPVAIAVATCAMLSGVGGAALFLPVFVILFPALGADYALSMSSAIGTALLTQVFGFLSGFVGYHRKGLIDYRSAIPFLRVSVPVAVCGALLFGAAQEHEMLLNIAYAVLMLGLCPVLLRRTAPPKTGNPDASAIGGLRILTARDGTVYRYPPPRQGPVGALFTSAGSLLTGFLGVGVGEVILPQLVKRNRVPVAVAAATSVFAVIVTISVASFTQISLLIDAGGLHAVPWNLVCYSIPGVLIGGQIGPRLHGLVPQRAIEKSIALLFGTIGLAMGWIVLRGN